MQICENEKCTGCGACANICPKKCVSLECLSDGFIYPIVNEQRCVRCGACQRVCPQKGKKGAERGSVRWVYEASSKDESLLLKSTSGGIFPELARIILKDNGVVFGAQLNTNDMTVNHSYIQIFDDIGKFSGSKYIGSNMQNCFQEVKKFLEQGRSVLFSGTPCQVDGLRMFLGKEYDRLYTVDFVCHGVASQRLWHLYINYLERQYGGRISDFRFRDKANGFMRFTFGVTIQDNEKVEKLHIPFCDNLFGKLFAEGKISRLSCYSCRYASTKRVSDITLADCIQGINKYQEQTGCSLVMVNTSKGQALFNSIESCIVYSTSSISRAKELQVHLTRPSIKPDCRDKIIKDLNVLSFESLENKYFGVEQIDHTNLFYRILRKLKRTAYKLKR